jgi:hypothetical protein
MMGISREIETAFLALAVGLANAFSRHTSK